MGSAIQVAHEAEFAWESRQSRRRRRRARARERYAAGREHGSGTRAWSWAALFSGVEEVLTRLERAAVEARSLNQSAASFWGRGTGAGLSETLRARAARLKNTGSMLAQLVISYRLFGLRTALLSRERAHELLQALHAQQAARFVAVSREQGGAFLKVGQLLSARGDILPAVWVEQLSTLQDAAPAIPQSELHTVLGRALGGHLAKHFVSFDPQPIAAASLGQVHRATTASGLEVAVKVRRPGIAKRIDDDLALLSLTLEALSDQLPALDWKTIKREIDNNIRAELDYAREAELTARAAAFFKSAQTVLVPEPLAELCSSELLTTRFVSGPKISVLLDALSSARGSGDVSAHARISEILGRLLNAYLRQMFELGMFQADPHPGNLLVTEGDTVVILDFGCAAELAPPIRQAYLTLMAAFFSADRPRTIEALVALGFRTRSGDPDTLLTFMDALLSELASAVQNGCVAWPEREELLARARQIGAAFAVDPVTEIPGHFVMIGRVLATLSGLFAQYKPDIDVARYVLPVVMPWNTVQ